MIIRARAPQGDECVDVLDIGQALRAHPVEGHTTVGFLLYTVLDAVVDTYFDALDTTEDELEQIESRIFETVGHTEQAPPAGSAAPCAASCSLFRRRVVPLRDVLQVILRQEVHPSARTRSATSRTSSTTSCG